MKIFSIITFFCLLTIQGITQKYFEWTPTLRQAYQKSISLQFEEAQMLVNQVRASAPNNLLVHQIENYIDFFKVYINEDEAEFERLESNKDRRLSAIKAGNKNSPYYLYLQANIRLQWALARLKFEEYATAFFEVNKAFKLLSKNTEKFPDFMPNQKDLGILHAMVGTIPDGPKRWTVEWLTSFEGSFEQGKKELESVIEYARHNDFIYEEEIYVFYSYLLLHLGNDGEEAWRIINTGNLKPNKSLMASFILANVAMRTDRGGEAIEILENRPDGKEYHPFPYLDYMLGLAKLQRLEEDADIHFQDFLNEYKGKNFIKDALQKMAWHRLVNGDERGYKYFIKQCELKGFTIVGSDKSALKESESGLIPNVDLLKARLLFDGGYLDKAYDLLKSKNADEFSSKKDILEYHYRMGRISHKLEKKEEAVKYYGLAIKEGSKEPWYFACRGALEMGHVYESLNKKEKAIAAFKKCQSIKPEEHKTALHQQAKAGLNRVRGN